MSTIVTGVRDVPATARDPVRGGRVRRLGDQHDVVGAGSASSMPQRGDRTPAADRLGQVAAADPEHLGDGDPGLVQQAGQLLGAGSGGGDDADPRAGVGCAQHIGESESDAADDGRPAVRSHHQHPGRGGRVLEGELVLDRHVVGEDHHVPAGVDRVQSLAEHCWPGHRQQHDRCVRMRRRGGPDGAGVLRRCRVELRCRPGRPGRRPRRPARPRRLRRRCPRMVIIRSFGPAPSGLEKPRSAASSMFNGVAIATWAAVIPGTDAAAWEIRSRVTESR